MSDQFRLMAHYNRHQNQKVYNAASRLPSDTLAQNRGAYFGSIIGTLNHIAVCDIIWMQRFSNHPAKFNGLGEVVARPTPTGLDQILAPELESLKQIRLELDGDIVNFAGELTPDHLNAALDFIDTQGNPYRKPFSSLVQHFFNHQTHHRGQVGTLLMQLGEDVGVTDLLELIPDVENSGV